MSIAPRDGCDQISSCRGRWPSLAMRARSRAECVRIERSRIETMPAASTSSSRNIKVSKQAVDEAFKALSNWGRWGKDDQIGTLNHITPARRRCRIQAHQARQGVRARHPAGTKRTAAGPVRQALEPDPHHAGDGHRRTGRPARRPALFRRRAQHADPVGHALGFAGPHLLSRQDVQRAPRQHRRLQRGQQARHRACQGQAGRPRRAARHRPLEERRHPRATARASPTTTSTPAPRRRRSRSARAIS